MTAQNAVLLVGHQFNHAFCGVSSVGLSVRTVVALTTFVGYALFPALVFAQSNTSHFRMCEDGSRHNVEQNAVCMPHNVVNGPETLERCCMRQHLFAVHIDNGVHTGKIGLHVVVGGYASLCVADVGIFQTQCVDVCRTPSGHQHQFGIGEGLFALLLVVHAQCVVLRLFYLCYTRLQRKLHTALFQLLAKPFGNVAVKCGKALFQKLNHHYFAPKTAVDAGKFHTDNTRTNDAKTAWNVVEAEQFGRGNHAFELRTLYGQHLCRRPRSDDDVVGSVFLAVCHKRFVGRKPRLAPYKGNSRHRH